MFPCEYNYGRMLLSDPLRPVLGRWVRSVPDCFRTRSSHVRTRVPDQDFGRYARHHAALVAVGLVTATRCDVAASASPQPRMMARIAARQIKPILRVSLPSARTHRSFVTEVADGSQRPSVRRGDAPSPVQSMGTPEPTRHNAA